MQTGLTVCTTRRADISGARKAKKQRQTTARPAALTLGRLGIQAAQVQLHAPVHAQEERAQNAGRLKQYEPADSLDPAGHGAAGHDGPQRNHLCRQQRGKVCQQLARLAVPEHVGGRIQGGRLCCRQGVCRRQPRSLAAGRGAWRGASPCGGAWRGCRARMAACCCCYCCPLAVLLHPAVHIRSAGGAGAWPAGAGLRLLRLLWAAGRRPQGGVGGRGTASRPRCQAGGSSTWLQLLVPKQEGEGGGSPRIC